MLLPQAQTVPSFLKATVKPPLKSPPPLMPRPPLNDGEATTGTLSVKLLFAEFGSCQKFAMEAVSVNVAPAAASTRTTKEIITLGRFPLSVPRSAVTVEPLAVHGCPWALQETKVAPFGICAATRVCSAVVLK